MAIDAVDNEDSHLHNPDDEGIDKSFKKLNEDFVYGIGKQTNPMAADIASNNLSYTKPTSTLESVNNPMASLNRTATPTQTATPIQKERPEENQDAFTKTNPMYTQNNKDDDDEFVDVEENDDDEPLTISDYMVDVNNAIVNNTSKNTSGGRKKRNKSKKTNVLNKSKKIINKSIKIINKKQLTKKK